MYQSFQVFAGKYLFSWIFWFHSHFHWFSQKSSGKFNTLFMQWGQLMKREKGYRIKSKNKIHFKDYNQTITELCQTFNNLSPINSNSSLRDQLAHCSGHPYSSSLWHSLCAYFTKPSKENCSCRMNPVFH